MKKLYYSITLNEGKIIQINLERTLNITKHYHITVKYFKRLEMQC